MHTSPLSLTLASKVHKTRSGLEVKGKSRGGNVVSQYSRIRKLKSEVELVKKDIKDIFGKLNISHSSFVLDKISCVEY